MEQRLRSSPKPECISAAALRDHARAAASAGQTPLCRSPTYSAMASESQTTLSPSIRQGTLPLGETLRYSRQLDSNPKGIKCSRNSMPNSRSSDHGRSDQDE